jgi:hypothetical protein
MGVDHRGFHITVTEQFLNRTDVGALLQKLRGATWTQASVAEALRMAEGETGRRWLLFHG